MEIWKIFLRNFRWAPEISEKFSTAPPDFGFYGHVLLGFSSKKRRAYFVENVVAVGRR